MKRRPLTDEEVEQAIDKIRRLYDDYVITYTKPFKLKKQFEDRYFEARKKRIDLTRFIMAELEVVQQLKTNQQTRLEEEEERRYRRKARAAKKPQVSLADRMLEQFHKQIERYPDMEVDERASYEIKKIFGALDTFETVHWPPLDSILRKVYPSFYSNPRVDLEPKLYALCKGAGNLPPIVNRYKALLLRLPRSVNDVEWEEKRLVLEVAFFCHQVISALNGIAAEDLEDEEKNTVENAREYMHILIQDFRLKDLKPSNFGGS